MTMPSAYTTAWRCGLHSLPLELLYEIVNFIDPRDSPTLVALSTYSPILAGIIEPRLFITDAAKANTMHYACSMGDVPLIRMAIVEYDVDPDSYDPRLLHFEPHVDYPPHHHHVRMGAMNLKMSTLQTAARAGQLDAVRALLYFGHKVAFPPYSAMRKFAKSFICPESLDFVHALLDCDWGRKFLDFHLRPQGFDITATRFSGISLRKAISVGMSMEVVHRMVDHKLSLRHIVGNGPNALAFTGPYSEQKSLLVSALESQDPETLVELLIQYGASIDGYVVPSLCKRPIKRLWSCHSTNLQVRSSKTIPIYVAAKHFATTGSTKLLDLCLSLGADINQETPALVKFGLKSKRILCKSRDSQRKPRSAKQGNLKAIKLTPLLVYLLSISWFSPADITNPIAGIKYFLGRGVELKPAQNKVVNGQANNANEYSCTETGGLVQIVSPAELLLDVMGSMTLGHGLLYDTVNFLVNQGCGLPENADCLRLYTVRGVRKAHMDELYQAIKQRQYLSAEKLLIEGYNYSSEVPDSRNLGLLHWCFVTRNPESGHQLPKLDNDMQRARENLVRKLVCLKAKASDKARCHSCPMNGTPLLFAAMAEDPKCIQIMMGSGYLHENGKRQINKRIELRDRATTIAALLEGELQVKQDTMNTSSQTLPWQIYALTERRSNVCDGKNSGNWQSCCPLALALGLVKKRGCSVLLHHILSTFDVQQFQLTFQAHIRRHLPSR